MNKYEFIIKSGFIMKYITIFIYIIKREYNAFFEL